MAGPISSLFVELKLSAEGFNNDIKAAGREAKAFEKNTKDLKATLTEMGTAMTAVGGAIVGAFAVAIKSAADFGDEMNDASKRTGVSTEALSKLKLAADTSGSSFDGLTTGLKFLGKNMELATSGSKQQMAAFNAAGISAKDLKDAHGDVNAILMKLADAFKDSEDGAGKTAISMQLLGKSGADMIPFLDEGSAGLKAWGDEAERSGRVMSTEAAAAADAFNDQLTVLEGSLAGVGGAIGTAFIPMLTNVFQKTTEVVNSVRGWITAHPDLTKAIGALGVALTGAGGLLLGLTGVMAILPSLTTAFAVLTGPIGLTIAAFTALVAGVVYFRKEIATVLIAALATVVKAFGTLVSAGETVAGALGQKGLANTLKEARTATEGFSKTLDAAVVAGMAEYGTLAKTETQLKAESAARTTVTVGTAKHTLALAENTAEQDKQQKKIADIIKANQESLLNYGTKIQESMTKSIDLISDRWVKMNATVAGILKKNETDLLNSEANIAKQSHDALATGTADYLHALDERIKDADDALKKIAEKNKAAVDSVKESAGKIFDDMFIKGENVFSSLSNLLKGGALSLGRSIFEDVTGQLLGPVKAAFDDFFKGLIESTGIKAFVSGLGEKLGGLLSGIFGEGGSVPGVPSIPGVSGGGAGSAAGGAASAATGGLMSTINMISGIAGALGSIVGAIGTMRLEGTMNAVEHNTRYTQIQLKDTMEQILQPMLGLVGLITDRVQELINQGDAIYNAIVGLHADALTEISAIGSIGSGLASIAAASFSGSASIVSAVTSGFASLIPHLDAIAEPMSAPSMPLPKLPSSQGITKSQDFLGFFKTGGVAERAGFAHVEEGELMIPREKQGSLGGTTVINVTIHESKNARDTASQVIAEIERRLKTNRSGIVDKLRLAVT